MFARLPDITADSLLHAIWADTKFYQNLHNHPLVSTDGETFVLKFFHSEHAKQYRQLLTSIDIIANTVNFEPCNIRITNNDAVKLQHFLTELNQQPELTTDIIDVTIESQKSELELKVELIKDAKTLLLEQRNLLNFKNTQSALQGNQKDCELGQQKLDQIDELLKLTKKYPAEVNASQLLTKVSNMLMPEQNPTLYMERGWSAWMYNRTLGLVFPSWDPGTVTILKKFREILAPLVQAEQNTEQHVQFTKT